MPTYIYEFEETGDTIEVEQKISEEAHEYLLHPEKMKLMKVFRVITGGGGIIFKGDGWTPPSNIPSTHTAKFPQDMKIDEAAIKNEGFRKPPERADLASDKKLEESRKFSHWLDNGGAETLEKHAPKINLNK